MVQKMMIFSILGSLLFLFISFRLGGTVAFDTPWLNHTFEMRPFVLAICILIIFWSYGVVAIFLRKIFRFFRGKPKHEKGLDHLQIALSGILLKDHKLAEKAIRKAKKYLGDIPMVAWLEGQVMLLNKDPHKAKAIFYELSAKENETTFGAYSICSIAINEGLNSDAINAIDSIIKTHPHAYDLIFQAISLSLKERNFLRARKYIPYIKDTKKARIVEAIIYAEEGADTSNQNLMKKASKMAPELPLNAINYAENLKNEGSYWGARRVLRKSFECVRCPEIYEKYVRCTSKISKKSILEFSRKIARELPESWLIRYKLLKNPENYGDSDKIGIETEEDAEKLEEAIKSVRSFWKCQHCGYESETWKSVCEGCGWVAEFKYQEEQEKSNEFIMLDS